MTNENIYSKLTPSAKEVLDELIEGYRDSLIEKAYALASERDTANREISLRDILEAQQPIEKSIKTRKDYLEYKRRRWTILISFSGAIYATAGLLLYLYQNKKFSIETDLGLIIAVIGIMITVLTFLYGQLFSMRQQSSKSISIKNNYTNIDNYDIVKRWQLIEQLTTSIMKSNNIGDSKTNTVNQVIRYLTENFTSSEKEYMAIRELLQARNKILHEGYNLSDAEKRQYIEVADSLIDKLEKAGNSSK